MDSVSAVKRALSVVGQGEYRLGAGDYNPVFTQGTHVLDIPFNPDRTGVGCDCWGLIAWAHGQRRHQPGYNKGPWASVEDDVNTDSAIEDSQHAQTLWLPVQAGQEQAGDIIVYHSVYLATDRVTGEHVCGVNGHGKMILMGHVGLLTFVGPNGWQDHETRVVQCFGPNGRRPGIMLTDSTIWIHHNAVWAAPNGVTTHTYRTDLETKVLRCRPQPALTYLPGQAP